MVDIFANKEFYGRSISDMAAHIIIDRALYTGDLIYELCLSKKLSEVLMPYLQSSIFLKQEDGILATLRYTDHKNLYWQGRLFEKTGSTIRDTHDMLYMLAMNAMAGDVRKALLRGSHRKNYKKENKK
jgi:hypothetical protein